MRVRTSELIGPALDLAVAECEGFRIDEVAEWSEFWMEHSDGRCGYSGKFNYSTNWSQGGPIIEREGISIKAQQPDWTAYIAICDGMTDRVLRGPTPLIAAMRCYVAIKLGDEVEIPEELK